MFQERQVTIMARKSKRGFAAMPEEKRQRIAREGGKHSHDNQYTSGRA